MDRTGYTILGIDPGSIKTGFGLIEVVANSYKHIENGLIVPPKDMVFKDRIGFIFSEVCEVIKEFHPDVIALEDIFIAKNAQSALKLGHVRGAVMSAAVIHGLPLFEYTPTHVKQSVVGHGRAEKYQIQAMICTLLGLKEPPYEDAADALAIALTHAFSM